MTLPMPNMIVTDLRQHLEICRELFAIAERESQSLRQSQTDLRAEVLLKKDLLPALDQSLDRLHRHRLDRDQRSPHAEVTENDIPPLLHEIQDLITRIIVLDRENEQALLRKGAPTRHLPHAQRQQPHFVANLYRRQNEAGELAAAGPHALDPVGS